MPWSTPPLTTVRTSNRDYIASRLKGPLVPNSVARVLADAGGGLAHLGYQYLDWLALQLLPDTSESQWLDRHGVIWLVNADGSRGRKAASFATGSATMTGASGKVFPSGSILTGFGSPAVSYQTTQDVTVSSTPAPVTLTALDAGAAGNLPLGDTLSVTTAVPGVDATATVVSLNGGADVESDDLLRARVLERIQLPPMGGDADDYVAWALAVPGVTRAWCSPREMGMGTVTIRFMCDALRATNIPSTNGFPLSQDVAAVAAYLDMVRPVAVQDRFVVAPIPQPVSCTIGNLSANTTATQNAIAASISKMLTQRGKPAYSLNGIAQGAQTIYAAWVSDAIFAAQGVASFDLTMADAVMPDAGHMAVLGAIAYA
jgi:uncharacterized phage protein gp47/JayE